jgi:hypothetical protein
MEVPAFDRTSILPEYNSINKFTHSQVDQDLLIKKQRKLFSTLQLSGD